MRGKPPRQTSLTEEAFSADAAHQGERAGAPIQPGQAHPRALGSLADCKISVEGANRERSSPGSRRQTSRHGGLKRGQMGERRRQGLRRERGDNPLPAGPGHFAHVEQSVGKAVWGAAFGSPPRRQEAIQEIGRRLERRRDEAPKVVPLSLPA